jgi:hypothetical protein
MLTKAITPPSAHAEAAKTIIEKILALRDEIPRFTIEGLNDGRIQNGGQVPDRFLESASVAIQKSIRMEQAGGADANTLRDAYAFALAFDPVVQELRAFARFVAHTIRVQRTTAGVCALDMYALAKRLAKREDGAELRPFVDDMGKKLKKPGRPRKSDATKSDPAPVSPAVPKTK